MAMTRPVTQADVACAYRDGYAAGHDDGTDHAAATTVGRIAELEGQLAATGLALAVVREALLRERGVTAWEDEG